MERKGIKRKERKSKGKRKEKGRKREKGVSSQRGKEAAAKKEERDDRPPPSTIESHRSCHRSPSSPSTLILNGKAPDLVFRVDYDFDLKSNF